MESRSQVPLPPVTFRFGATGPPRRHSRAINMKPQLLPGQRASSRRTTDARAVQRGPLVYCLEQIDQPAAFPLKDCGAKSGPEIPATQFRKNFQKDLLGGITLLRHPGTAYGESSEPGPSLFHYSGEPRKFKPISLTFIPYYAWANRTATPMQVWTPLSQAAAG